MRLTKTQRLEAGRNVTSQLASFISIVVISMLAVTVYLGIAYSSEAMDRNVSRYYDERSMQDLQVFSPLLLTEEDAEAIRALDGVEDAEGSFETVAQLPTELQSYTVSVISLPERIAVPKITEGRAPQAEDECMIEGLLAEQTGIKTGDSIRLQTRTGGLAALMKRRDFTVTGIFDHPDHITDKIDITEYVIVTDDAFDQSLLEGCWPRLRVKLSGLPENRFSKAYSKALLPVKEAVEQLSDERMPARVEDVRSSYSQRIDDGEKQLAEGKLKLEDAEKALAEGAQRLQDGSEQIAEAEKKLAEGEQKIAENEKKLADARQQIADGEKQLEDGERQLEEAKAANADKLAQYDQGLKDLADAERQLGLAPGQLTDGELKLIDGKRQLNSAADKLSEADRLLSELELFHDDPESRTEEDLDKFERDARSFVNDFYEENEETFMKAVDDFLKALDEAGVETLEEAYQLLDETLRDDLQKGMRQYREKLAEWERGRIDYYYSGEQYLDGMALYEKGKKALNEGAEAIQKLQDAEQQIAEKRAELEDAKKQVEDGSRQLNEAKATLEESRQALEDGKTRQADGEREIAEKREEYESGLETWKSGREGLDQIETLFAKINTADWTILDNLANTGYVYAYENSSNLSSLSSTFSLLFIVIAALVIYASVSRMVDEQSILVGTTKAMGFYNREIMAKYLFFGVLSPVLGVIAGILLAHFVLQPLVLKMYAPYYTIAKAPKCFLILPTVFLSVGGVVLGVVAVLVATLSLLRSTTVELMKGKQPEVKRKARTKSSGSLYTRLIYLNMMSDLTRVIVTIVSVAGCCILLMVGFTLKFGEDRIIGKQYGEVLTFDADLTYDSDNTEGEQRLMKFLDRKGIDYIRVFQENRVFSGGQRISACTLICSEPSQLPGWYNLRDINSSEFLPVPEHGILITKRMHETCYLGLGDSLTFYDTSMVPSTAEITGIFNNYFGQMAFLSPNAYREIFGEEVDPNCFYLKLDGNDLETLRAQASKIDGFLSLNDAASRKEQIKNTSKAMDVVIIFMIVCAGVMSWFILDNLSGSYMLHKKKELTVMRVNGFTTGECVRYAATELVITTVLGILIGVPVGRWLGYYVIRLTEQSFLQLDRTLDWRSVVFSILITAAFSLIINGIALSKVKDLKLSDAAN